MPNRHNHATAHEPYTDRLHRAKPEPAISGPGILARRMTRMHMKTFGQGLILPGSR